MSAFEIEAVTPAHALTLAIAELGSNLRVLAGHDIIENYRALKGGDQIKVTPPDKIGYHFVLNPVPYRRGADRVLIDPMREGKFNDDWIRAPVEYVQFYNGDRVLVVPVSRAPEEAAK